MVTRLKIGSATLVVVSDGQERRRLSETYTGFTDADAERFREYMDADGTVLGDYACYAIHADGKTVLIDTGWGDGVEYSGRKHGGLLMQELAEAGIKPEDVDVVTFSHLHVDHVGWNLVEEAGGVRPRFPRARYLVPQHDWEYFDGGKGREQNLPGRHSDASFKRCVKPLEGLGVLDTFAGDAAIGPSLNAVSTPGHTPGHTSFLLRSQGEQAFILGDVAIRVLDAEHPELRVVYDEDQDLNLRTRRHVLDRIEREALLVAACHLPNPGLGHFEPIDGQRRWVPFVPTPQPSTRDL